MEDPLRKNFLFRSVVSTLVAVTLGSPGWAAEKKAQDIKTVPLDVEASVLKWTGKKLTGAHNGTVKLKGGQVALAGKGLAGGEFEIDMTSIQNLDLQDPAYKAKLEGHLKSDDFFGVEKHPTARFKISKIRRLPGAMADQPTHEITGDLTIKGITRPVTFPSVIQIKDGKARAAGTVTVDRSQFDVRYGSQKFFPNIGDKIIYDEFTIELDVVGSL
jgi:polyisoprenoid-binding protein YceI